MKLNNKGWGFRDMLVYSGILLFFFILATIYISTLYNNINSDISNNVSDSNTIVKDEVNDEVDNEIIDKEVEIDYSYYHNKEMEIEKAVYTYLLNNNIIIVSNIINISLDDLINQGYIDPINDYVTNEKCTGYVNVIGEGTDYDIREYIKCSNYTTEGY